VIRERLAQQVRQVQFLDQQDQLVLRVPLVLLERLVLIQQFLDQQVRLVRLALLEQQVLREIDQDSFMISPHLQAQVILVVVL
jgi:hypothetical protein